MTKLFKDVQVLVVASAHRPPLIEKHLTCRHEISLTPDLEPPLPTELNRSHWLRYVAQAHQDLAGTYRCFKGHQLALAKAAKPYIAVFEDDAEPLDKDWIRVVNWATRQAERYDVVCLHGRGVQLPAQPAEILDGVLASELKPSQLVHAPGCTLAYVVKKSKLGPLLEAKFDGLPIDEWFTQHLNLLVVREVVFKHNRVQGSLIDLDHWIAD